MNDNSGDRLGPRVQSRPRRVGLLAATAAAIALLAAACGGVQPAAAPSASTGAMTAQKADAFALCVRDHGVAGFYISATTGGHYNGSGLNLPGWHSTPVTAGSPVLQSALKACNHLLGLGGLKADNPGLLTSMLKAAACMRAHGFPDYPDPTQQDNQVVEPPLPTTIDASSPQFQSAAQACNAGQ